MARRGGVTVRDFRDGEEAQILAIARDLQAHEAALADRLKSPDDIGAWYVDALRKDVAELRGHFLVAEDDDVIAGYALLLFYDSSDDREEVFYTYAHVGELGVLREHRGRGIGTALLAECEEIARAAGQKWLRLGVLASNEGAIRLYERTGFRVRFHRLEKPLT